MLFGTSTEQTRRKGAIALAPADSSARVVYRHAWPVRIFHWINAVSFVLLLMSGLQIFNAYPRLHWGHDGYQGMPAAFEIGGVPDLTRRLSWVQFGSYRIDTSGTLGVAKEIPLEGVKNIAFPPWLTLPSATGDLASGMGWHFMMLWVLIINLGIYVLYGVASGRFWRELLPNRGQLRMHSIGQDIWRHLCFKRSVGMEALSYNLLQKMSYIAVLFVLLPAMILTGLTMSPSAVAAFPGLIDLFHGRQTARTLHFIFASVLVLFVLVHLFQVIISGFRNHMRSITTGFFVIAETEDCEDMDNSTQVAPGR